MLLALYALSVISLLELALWLPVVWRWRKPVASMLAIGLALVAGLIFGLRPNFWTALVLFFNLYRLINLLRLVEGRTQSDYLYQTARRSSLTLIGLQLVVLSLVASDQYFGLDSTNWYYLLAFGQLAAAIVVSSSTLHHLRTSRPPTSITQHADSQLPTLTVAIPARNETDNLEACLRSLLASNYPKLEILVLDDCSQERRTPDIIRSFAQHGVRFIAGQVPPANWLAKNYAYHQLVQEASGQMLLFCGVDVRFAPGSLRAVVETAIAKKKSMLSIIPSNQIADWWRLEPLLVQPSRYAWELALPRRWLRRPAVLSSCWLISKQLLDRSGGFEAATQSTSPESYFARQAIRQIFGYSFIQSDARLSIHSVKNLSDQRDTAIRTRYPQLHRRPEFTAIVSLTEFATLIAPFIVAIIGLVDSIWPLLIISLISSGLQSFAYGQIVSLCYRSPALRGYLILPLAAGYDLALLNYSMWRYEFREVIWKDRNVCIPVMRLNRS